MGHRKGESRGQASLFPIMLEELVEAGSVVRVVDAWVGTLDVKQLGFGRAQARAMGRPPYDPGDLLRLYIWGYLNGVRSSRALERECRRNVECMWLLGRLAPDHKTIAEFRRCNSEAMVKVCAAFVQFGRAQHLIAGTTVAIDGSKVGAVASRKAVIKREDLQEQARRNAEEIRKYLEGLDQADDQAGPSPAQGPQVQVALEQLRKEGARIARGVEQLASSGSSALVSTEPEARIMKSLHGKPGYNLQTAVDTQSHLIVHHEVGAQGTDNRQLKPMAEGSARVLEGPCTVVADAGYANGEQIAALGEQGIKCYVASNRSVNNQGQGDLYDRTKFRYDPRQDRYTCPAGQILNRKQINQAQNTVVYAARSQDCGRCAQKPACTHSAQRYISRHLYEPALQANERRLAARPDMMRLRRQTVEHPFGTIKYQILRNARLLVRGLRGARSELSLAVLAYNLKRTINMKGAAWMQAAILAT